MADDITALVAELKRLDAEAHQGPMSPENRARNGASKVAVSQGRARAYFYHPQDRSLYIAMRNALPTLLSALEQAQQEKAARALMDAREREPEMAKQIMEQAVEIVRMRDRIAELERALRSGLETCEIAKDMTFAPWATHAKKLLALVGEKGESDG